MRHEQGRTKMTNNQETFLTLVRAGLWEKEALLIPFKDINFSELLSLAEDQSVVGLVAAGLENVTDVKVPKEVLLQFIGESLQLEQKNKAMNDFIGKLINEMRHAGIDALLVKGQGIAQCYERPLWRASGDIDLLLDAQNYEKAKLFLKALASKVEPEGRYLKHSAYAIGGWIVELHGNMKTRHSWRMDRVIDEVQRETFQSRLFRTVEIGRAEIQLPAPNSDVIIVFTHYLKHLFGGGIGLRQLCDWCRLLRTYQYEIDHRHLELRLKKMGIVSEWKAFAAYAVEHLGMPTEAMPLYFGDEKWKRKAKRISDIVLRSGTFGHADHSYIKQSPFVIRKMKSFWKGTKEHFRLITVFPKDALKFYLFFIVNRSNDAMRGE